VKTLCLYTDSKSTGRITGSCGVVGVGIKNLSARLDIQVLERYYPLEDKVSPVIAKDSSDINLFFEELYPRSLASNEALNLVYFNLHYFQKPSVFESADVLIFNSDFLKKCFQHQFRLTMSRDCLAKMVVIPPHSTTSLFPAGFPSIGLSFNIKNFDFNDYYIGHSFRPYKHNYLYTLEVLSRLNHLAKKNGKKGVRFLIPQITSDEFFKTIEENNLDENLYEVLVPLPGLDNRSLRRLMRVSDFCLSFDDVIEAFGFYPIESVYETCPVYTNGSGNLRFLLPPGNGIHVLDDLNVHFGNKKQKGVALDSISKKIFHSIVTKEGKRSCLSGKKIIHKMYGEKIYTESFKKVFSEKVEKKKSSHKFRSYKKCRIGLSPYVRLADLKQRQFITDQGNFELSKDINIAKILNSEIDTDWIPHLNSSIFTIQDFF
jgi:hypothetical protein